MFVYNDVWKTHIKSVIKSHLITQLSTKKICICIKIHITSIKAYNNRSIKAIDEVYWLFNMAFA